MQDCNAFEYTQKKVGNLKKHGKQKLVLKSLMMTRIPANIEYQTQLKKVVFCDIDVHFLPSEMKNLVKIVFFIDNTRST
jgi:hypothetical protein